MNIKTTLKFTFGGLGSALLLTAAAAMPAFAEEGVTTMATTAPLNLRTEANIQASVTDVIPQGTSVQVFGMTSDGWYDVEYNSKRGHCWYQYLNFEGKAENTVHDGHETDMYATAPLNVRTQPNTNAGIIGSLAKGEFVPVVNKQDGWFKVIFNGQEAYCYGEYLGFGQTHKTECKTDTPTEASGSTMNKLTVAYPLNIRTQPNTAASILGSFKVGEVINVIAMEGDWCKIEYKGQTAYCHAAYLK